MTKRYLSGGRYIDDPLFIVPLTSLTGDPLYDPAANTGRMVQCDDGNRYHSDGTQWRLNLTGGAVDGVTVVRDTELFLQEFAEADRPSAVTSDRRFIQNGDTDLPEVSDGTQWRSLVDEARAAEIASSVLTDVLRPAFNLQMIEIATAGTEEVGARYVGDGAIGRALSFCTGYAAAYRDDDVDIPSFAINIKSGYIVREQLTLGTAPFNHVRIVSEDAEVTVDATYLTKAVSLSGPSHAWINVASSGTSPTISTVFKPVGTPPEDPNSSISPYAPKTIGLRLAGGASASVAAQTVDLAGDAMSPKRAGFRQWYTNIESSGQLVLFQTDMRDATGIGLSVVGGDARVWATSTEGAALTGLDVNSGTVFLGADTGDGANSLGMGYYGQSFRRDSLVDGSLDIRVRNGGQLRNNTPLLRGGTSQPRNVWTASGFFSDVRDPAPEPTPMAHYTVGTVPAATDYPWALFVVTDGDGGGPCLAMSDGTDWRRIALGAAISAT